MDFEIAVIGAGVVGLAIGRELAINGKEVIIIEKNEHYGQEMSSRNSEVIHAGIYYPPDSLKSKLCILGKHLLYNYLEARNLPYRKCGKIIVATNKEDMAQLSVIAENGLKAGVDDLRLISKEELTQLEPNIFGVAGVLSSSSGIIDAHSFMDSLAGEFRQKNGEIATYSEVTGIDKIDDGYRLTVSHDGEAEKFTCKWVINATGLYADKIAALTGLDIDRLGYHLYWCQGNYFRIKNRPEYKISHLIYPVPPKNLSGLGVHATIDLAGGVKFGPDVNYLEENIEDYHVAAEKVSEFTKAIKTYIPHIRESDLAPDMAGIRAKRQGPGDDFRDFIIHHEADNGLHGFINLVGIESPGLTASLAIAIHVTNIIN